MGHVVIWRLAWAGATHQGHGRRRSVAGAGLGKGRGIRAGGPAALWKQVRHALPSLALGPAAPGAARRCHRARPGPGGERGGGLEPARRHRLVRRPARRVRHGSGSLLRM